MAIKNKKPGTSIWVDITKKDGEVIPGEYVANYEILDDTEAVVDSGSLNKATDNISFELRIDRSVTTTYEGEYLVKVLMSNVDGYGEYIYYQRFKFSNA